MFYYAIMQVARVAEESIIFGRQFDTDNMTCSQLKLVLAQNILLRNVLASHHWSKACTDFTINITHFAPASTLSSHLMGFSIELEIEMQRQVKPWPSFQKYFLLMKPFNLPL